MTNYTVFANNSQTGVMFNFSMAILADTDSDGLPDGPSVTGLVVDQDDDGDGLSDELEVKCGSSSSNINDVAKVDENGDCLVEDSSGDSSSESKFNYFLCCIPLILLLLLLLNFFGRQQAVFLDAEPEHTTSEPKCLDGVGTRDDPFILKTLSNVKPGSLVFSKEAFTTKKVSEDEFFMARDEYDSNNHDRFKIINQHLEGQSPSRFATKLVRRLNSDDDGILKYQIAFDDRESPTTSAESYETLFKVGNKSVYFKWTVEMKGYKRSQKQKLEAKAAEEKAAKEAKAAEEKAAKEAKAAEEKAAKDAKAAAEKKPVTREVKKQEELKRVKSRAKTIDFKTLGKATNTTLKSEVKKGATTLEVANAKEFAQAGTAAISDESGSSVISWTGKNGNALTGVKGVTRVFGTATVLTVKDDLHVIKGI